MANVLVCDDERSIRELLEIALRKEGHKVEIVNSGELAMKKIESARYDVIVTDIKMPRIDGIEVLKHAHRVSPASAVVLITLVFLVGLIFLFDLAFAKASLYLFK